MHVDPVLLRDQVERFQAEYLAIPMGQQHLARYPIQRQQGRANFQAISEARRRGEDVTDLVLAKLLPHLNTSANRARGAWIHVAPTITKEIRLWFENAGLKTKEEWPEVAVVVLDFVEAANQGPDGLATACERFGASPLSKGLQCAFMTPILNALRPDDYRVVNLMSRRTLFALAGKRPSWQVRNYPEGNARMVELHEEVMRVWGGPVPDHLAPGDLTDCFAYWYAGLRDKPAPKFSKKPPKATASRVMEPAVPFAGPKTLFKKVDYDLSGLLHAIDLGDIGLPDIQRPFVWTPSKVRDLFDSMYRGFPVGYLLFWSNSQISGAKHIGLGEKGHKVPNLLIVDGQQRLTSLYAVLRGRKVLDADFRPARIEIAFRPRDGRFAVADAAILNDPEWVPSISDLWGRGGGSWSAINGFLKSLEARKDVTHDDREAIAHNIDRLYDLQKFPFTALEIVPDIDEESVADIFVRINSEGVKLNQADFIMTLLSVFWDEGRAQLEEFARASKAPPAVTGKPSAFNYLVDVSPERLLRVVIALGFNRARLRAMYQILRGKDVESGQFLPERRDEQFGRLKDAQPQVLNLTYWHLFLDAIGQAGFRRHSLLSSEIGAYFAYVFYLVGRLRCGVPEHALRRAVARWFFMTSLTARYSASPETAMEEDLARLKGVTTSGRFLETLDAVISSTLTNDYWSITLPMQLETSSSRSPAFLAFVAAQCILQAPVLFSAKALADALNPEIKAPKAAVDLHHLFPRAHLMTVGLSEKKTINQVGNLSFVEWPENIDIKDRPPSAYLPEIADRWRAKKSAWTEMCDLHALPEGWEVMDYDEFLQARRRHMASVIRRGFERL